ncbi:MAG: 2-C-methyl-D-erythritol 2,4-cyclodiphosphate synthase [Gammaproteobacteria bacterium]|nr:2-C-methyl-D-erythritol 2,4-cyclodiphosphate synthase [Gammaproteobacteria bacterium]
MKIGQGYDVHRLVEGRKLIIGGVDIPYNLGLEAHSDGDVLIHALCDALLGAAGLGDIGKHFPDTDETFKDANSRELLKSVIAKIEENGLKLNNVDCTIIAQAPKMAPHIDTMRENLAADCHITVEYVNIKATTTEQLGFTGRGEGIAAQAVVLLNE